MVERPSLITWKHLGAILGALTGLIVVFGFLHGVVILPNALEEILPRVDQRIESHGARPHHATVEALERVRERLTILETRIEDLGGRR